LRKVSQGRDFAAVVLEIIIELIFHMIKFSQGGKLCSCENQPLSGAVWGDDVLPVG
jgi:hypothetical protein